jgi:hypothetical protein
VDDLVVVVELAGHIRRYIEGFAGGVALDAAGRVLEGLDVQGRTEPSLCRLKVSWDFFTQVLSW